MTAKRTVSSIVATVVIAVGLLFVGNAPATAESADAQPITIYVPFVDQPQRSSCADGVESRTVSTVYTVTVDPATPSIWGIVGADHATDWSPLRPLTPAEAHTLHCGLPARVAALQAQRLALRREVQRLRAELAAAHRG
jgi:hypothetical protein